MIFNTKNLNDFYYFCIFANDKTIKGYVFAAVRR